MSGRGQGTQAEAQGFQTPIGFHDAYVAAPSQKAALEAWGSDADLFARGSAEQVTEPKLMAAPLERPGEVIKLLRGTEAEQVAALGKAAVKGGSKKAGSRIKSGMTKKQKPSRASLDEAEEELKKLEGEQAKELAAIENEVQAIERKRRELQRRQKRDLGELEAKAERERARYEQELERWKRE